MKNKSVSAKKNSTTSRSARALRYCAVPFAAFFATQSASAATIVWDGSANTGVWATIANWSSDPNPVPGTGDTARFIDGGGSTDTIDLGAGGVTVNTISFETSSAAAYTIGSGAIGSQTLTLDNGGAINVNSAVAQQEVFNANIVLGTDGTASNFTITNNRAGFSAGPYLLFNGAITGSTGSGLKTLTFDANGTAATNSFSALGNISNGTSGTVKLVKKGDGIMTLGNSTSTMSYTGGTYLDAGTLQIVGNANNLQAGTSLYIAGGTNLNSINQAGGNYSNIVQQWNGDFSFNDVNKYVGSALQQMTFNGGTVDLGATGTDTVRTVNALANTLTVNSVISNGTNTTTTGLTKTGAGTMVLGGNNTYTGTTTVNAGTLTITGAPTGGGAYATRGSGTLTISGTAGTINASSVVTIAGGNLQLTNTSTAEGSVNRLSNSTAITSNGGTLTYNNTSGDTYAENVGNVTLNGGQLNTVLSTNMAAGKQTLTFNSLTQNNRSTATFSSATTTPNATSNIINVVGATATPAGQIIGPWATVGTSATVQTDYAVYDAAGNIVAANIAGSLDSTWTDSTKAYTSNFLGGGASNALSAVTHNMAALRNLPAFGNANTATTIAIPTGGNLNTFGLLNANQGLWTINQVTGSTGALSTPSGGGSIYINTGNGTSAGNGAITIGAPINDNGGAVSIVKTGTGNSVAVGQGVLTLANVTSNFTGATVINGGAIVLNTSGALANGGLASSLGAASTSADNLVINGGFLQYGTASTAVSTNRLFSIGAMGGTIDSSASTTATMSFIGTGAMGFASQTGPRTLTLQGSNVGVAASTSGSNSSLSTIALLIGDNSGATSLTKTGAGTWAITNSASTYTGPTTISQGILNVGTFAAANTASSLGKGSATTVATDLILNGGTLQYSNNTAATTNRLFSVGTSNGTIDSSAASPGNTLSFTATGVMGFNNTVGARTLTLTGTNFGANSMGLRLDDFGGLTNLTKSDKGTWVLANAGNNYTGVTTINSGILSVSKFANGGVASSIGASTNLPANLVMTAENANNGGSLATLLGLVQPSTPIALANVAPTLKYTGTGDSTDRIIKFTIGSNDRTAVLDASGTGALNFTNANFTTNSTASFSTAARRLALVLTGGNSADYTIANTISGIITDNGSEPTSIVKTGHGTWVLAGNNSYGTISTNGFGTIVNQGTLVLSGSPTGTVKTTVNAGGTLKLDYSTNDTSKLANTTGILQLGGGTLELSGGSHVEVVTSTTLAAGASSVTQTNSGTATLNMGAITRSAGSTLNLGTGGIVLTSIGSPSTLLTATAGAYATVGDTDWAAKNAGNTAIVGFSTVGAYSLTTAGALGGGGNQSDVDSGVDTTLATGDSTSTLRFNQNEARTITIGGGQILTLTQGGLLVTSNVNPGSGTSTITGGTLKPGSNDALQIIQNSPKGLTIESIVANGSGASALTKSGSGTLTLTNVNTYTGATFVNSGTLTISGTGSLNSGNYAGAITIAQGATLNYTSSANQTLSGGTSGFGNFVWNPSSNSSILVTGARGATPAVLTIKSGIVSGIVGNLGTGPASDLILDGGIIRTKDGGGGADQTSRLFTLGAGGGTIQIDDLTVPGSTTRPTEFIGTGAIAFTGSGARTLKFESAIMNVNKFSPALGDGPGGATSVIMGGTAGAYGVWALDGANTYTGTTTVNGGHLSIRKTQSVNGGVAYFTPANITVTPGAGVAGIAIGVGAGPTYFDSTAIATILDSSHLGASTTTTGLKVGAQFGLDTTAGDFTYAGTLADLTAGDSNVFNLAKHGTGTLTLTGNNTYTGTTTIYGSGIGHGTGTSILRAGSATAFGPATTANIVFDQGAFSLINKLQLFGNNVTVIGLNSPVMNHRDGSGQNIIESGSSDTSGTGTDILTINNTTTSTWNNASGGNGPISRIQDGSTRRLGITKGGAGTLELGGTNTYTGGTIINAGVLRLLNTQALGGASGAAGTVTFGASSTGTLRLNANSITIVGLDTNATVGTPVVENGTAGNATLTVNNTANSTFAGVLQNGAAGTLLLTKSGAGTLTLSGDNTYGGATAVNAGKLVLSGNNTTATGDIAVASGAVVQFNGTSSINGGAYNALNRDVTINAGGTAVFGPSFGTGIADVQTALTNRILAGSAGAIAADNYAGDDFDFAAAGLTNASLGAVGNVTYSGTLTPNGGTYRLGGGGGTLTYPAAITGGTAPLTITGASTGSVVLSNNTNALGTLTVSSGVLDLNATTGQTATSVAISGGTIQNGTITGTTYTVSGGTITASLGGSGALGSTGTPTLNANNSGFSGAVNITGGTLKAVDSRSLGTNTVTLNGGNLSLASDGTGTGLGNGKLENISYGNDIALSGAGQTITVGQFTANVGTLNAANKTLQLDTLSIGAQTLTVTNNNGFGLEFTGTTTLTGATASIFSVGTANVSTAVFGLTLNGLVSDGATSSANDAVILTKSGAGTLVLKGNNTTFGGNGGATGQIIDITDGYLAASTDAALGVTGATGNMVRISTNNTAKGFLATGSFSTDRTFRLNAGNNALDVTQGNTLTLTTPFSLQTASNALRKNDNGVLEINANNSTWTGIATVAAGVLKVSNAGALGTTAGNTVVSNAVGSAVQINGVNISELFNLTGSGINSGGALENLSGTNALSGAITLGGAATIGSTADTLTLSGGISGANALTFSGAGGIAVTTAAIGAVSSITKIGSGTTTLSVLSNSFVGGLTVNAGTFKIDGTTAKIGGTGAISVTNGATLTLDNTAGNVDNRLTTRAITLAGATFNFTGNGATVETLGALTAINAGLTTINTNTSGTLKFASQTARNAGGVVNVVSGGTSSVQFTTAPALTPASTGILPGWFAGNEFATHGGNNTAIVAFTGYTTGDLGTVVATTGTFKPSGAQTNVNTKTINALNLTGSIGATMNAGQTLTLTAGGLINSGSGNISGGFLSPTVELIANYSADSAISSIITGSQAFTKTGSGNLTLSALDNYTGTTTINQGTLTLGGGNNTLAVNKPMVINNGGTLALGSNNQYIGNLSSTGTVEGAGGSITGSGTLTVNQTSNLTFAGNIGGSVKLTLTGNGSTLTLSNANDTTGALNLLGGRNPVLDASQVNQPGNGLSLIDGGTLLNIGNIRISQASLIIDNTGTKGLADRVKDSATITLDGGAILFKGRAQSNSTEALGDVTASSGRSFLTAVAGGTNVNSATLTLNSLTRTTGASIALNFNQGSSLGQIGNNSRIVVTTALSGNLAPVNGVVPGVSIGQSGGFVGYAPGLGFGQLGTAGFPANYSLALNAAAATDNVNAPSAAVVKAGGQTINSLSAGDITFLNATDRLTIASGMVNQSSGFPHAYGTTAIRGEITSGLSSGELFYYKFGGGGGNGTLGNSVINSVITDNGATRVSLVVQGADRTNLQGSSDQPGMQPAVSAPNTYTGGTFVNGNGASAFGLFATNAGDVTIPAANDPTKGLVITNSGVTMLNSAGQIAASNIVTLNGASLLTYLGNNTQAGIVFNSYGSFTATTPTVTAGNILTITGNISSTPGNVAVVPLISGGTLDLNNTSHDITVDGGATTASLFHAGNGAAVTGLTISSAIRSLTDSSGSITKLGTGVLELITGANTFTGGLNINAGALKASSASALGGSGNVATLNNNAAIWLNATVNGGQTIVVSASGGTIASLGNNTLADNITLNGALTISLADPTLNNTDRDITYSAAITGTGGLTVTGNVNNPFNATPRALLLTNATSQTNTFTGGLTIGSGGRVKPTATFNIGSLTGSLTVNTGGVLDMNAKDQMVGNFTGTGGQVLGGTAVLTIGNGNTGGGNYAGIISTAISLNKIGTGTITLSGANTYSGSTSANGGTLALDFASTGAPLTNIISASSALSLGGGTLSVQGKASATNTQAFASTTATSNSTLTVTQNSATSLDVNLAGLTFTGGAGINFTGSTGTTVGARFITSSSAGANDGLTRLGGGSMWNGTGWASITDSGGTKYVTAWGGTYTDAYTGLDTPLGSVVIPDSGTAEVRILEDGATSAPNTLAAATTTINSLLMSAATTASTIKMNAIGANDTLVVGNGASAAGAIAVANGAQGLTIGESADQGFLTAGSSGASTLALNTQNAAAVQGIVVNSKITNNAGSGAVSISAGGAGGTVTLNGVNTYTGTTAIGNGTLEIGGGGSLGSGGSYAGNISIGGGGTLKYNSSATQTLSGVISGVGGLVKDGAGTLTLSVVNTYTGGTVVNGGILSLPAFTADTGSIRGELTVNNAAKATFSASLGYSAPANTLATINLNNGSTLEYTGAGNATFTGVTVNMTGGNWTQTNPAAKYDLFQTGSYGQGAINTLASATTSEISARLSMRSYTPVFTVAEGAAAVDLLVSGALLVEGAFGITKAGPGLMALTSAGNTYTGQTTISAGTLQLGNNTSTGSLSPSSAIVNNGTLAFNRTSPLVQGTDFNSVISGTGGVSQLGSGTTTLSGGNTYTGATLVSNGTLLVSGSISGSAVTVSGTGTLGSSSGTTGGLVGSVTVTSGGTLAPGASTGILTSTGNLTMSSGSTFAAEVNTTGVGTGYDQMVVAGNVNLGGSTLSLTGTYTGNGDVFTLILNNGSNAITGTFSGISNGSSVFLGGQEFQISYFDIASTGGFELSGGNDVSLMAVPEPGAAVSLLGGLGLLLGLRRRRRA